MAEINLNRRDFIKLSAVGIAVAAGTSSKVTDAKAISESLASPEPEHGDTYAFTTGLGLGSLVLVTHRTEQTVRAIVGEATPTTDLLMDGTTVDATEMHDYVEVTSPIANPIVETEKPETKVEDQRIEITRTFEFPIAFDDSLLSVGAETQMEIDALGLVNEARIAAATGKKAVAGVGRLEVVENRSKNILSATFTARVAPHEYKQDYSGPNIETRPITLIELATKDANNATVNLPGVVRQEVLIHGLPKVDPKPWLVIPEGPAKELEEKLKKADLELRMENDGIHAAIYRKDSNLPINDVLVDMTDPNKPTWSRNYTYLDFKGHPDEEFINNRICLPQSLEMIEVDDKGKINFDFPGYVWNKETNQFDRKTFEGEPVLNIIEAQLEIIKYGDMSIDIVNRRHFDRLIDFKTSSLKLNNLDEPIKGQYWAGMGIPVRQSDNTYRPIRTTAYTLNSFVLTKLSFVFYERKNGAKSAIIVDAPYLGTSVDSLKNWSSYFEKNPDNEFWVKDIIQ